MIVSDARAFQSTSKMQIFDHPSWRRQNLDRTGPDHGSDHGPDPGSDQGKKFKILLSKLY